MMMSDDEWEGVEAAVMKQQIDSGEMPEHLKRLERELQDAWRDGGHG